MIKSTQFLMSVAGERQISEQRQVLLGLRTPREEEGTDKTNASESSADGPPQPSGSKS